jgi:hypothetical protein
MFQDTFIVFAELPQYIIEKRERRIFMTKSSHFMEYLKIHKISLEQDLEDARNNVPIPEDEYFESDSYYMGAIDTMEHILSVASDIMIDNERVY